MQISIEMNTILDQLQSIAGPAFSRLRSLPANDLGNALIDMYYTREDLHTRELIRDFLNFAGVVWLRKLLTKDTGPITSSVKPFASLSDYVTLLAANDDTEGLVLNA